MRPIRFLASLVPLLLAPQAMAATFFQPAGTDAAPGTCGAPPYANLREAIHCTNSNGEDDTIILGSGAHVLSLGEVSIGPDGGHTLTVQGGIIQQSSLTRVVHVQTGAEVTMEQTTVRDGFVGAAPRVGAGIWNEGTLTLHTCWIENNRIDGATSFSDGGAGVNSDGDLFVDQTVFSGNQMVGSPGAGGGLRVGASGAAEISRSTFVNNRINGYATVGGALAAFGTTDLEETSLEDNRAYAAGGLYAEGTTVGVQRSSITDNRAIDQGGGLAADGTTTVGLRNTTISGNESGSFGGGARTGTLVTLVGEFVTVAGNNAGAGADGVHCGGTCSFSTTIFDDGCLAVTAGADSLADAAGCGSATVGFTGLEPLTYTAWTWGHPLNSASDALAAAASCLPTDQWGTSRVAWCDVGAVEMP